MNAAHEEPLSTRQPAPAIIPVLEHHISGNTLDHATLGSVTWDGAHPPANAPAGQKDYWKARQGLLGINDDAGPLTPREILFVERFNALNNSLTWIPKGSSGFGVSSNDFYWPWKSKEEYELKSTVNNIWSITRDIRQAVHGARRHLDSSGHQIVVKDKFVVDLGLATASDDLVANLARYNIDYGNKYQIKTLLLMDGNGRRLINIRLER